MICRASHSAVGCRVTSNHSNCRGPWLRTRNANNQPQRSTVGTSTAHINSSDHLHVVSKKRPPGLRRRPPTPHHVFGDRRLGDFEPQHQQFAMDPGRTPERILVAHPSDEIAQLTIDLWPPCPISGFPAPKRFEAGAVLSQDGFRLHDPGYLEQTGPNPRHPYQQRPITAVQPQPRRRSPQCDVELMMKKRSSRLLACVAT